MYILSLNNYLDKHEMRNTSPYLFTYITFYVPGWVLFFFSHHFFPSNLILYTYIYISLFYHIDMMKTMTPALRVSADKRQL